MGQPLRANRLWQTHGGYMDRHSRMLDTEAGTNRRSVKRPETRVNGRPSAEKSIRCGKVDAPVRPHYERKQVERNCCHCGDSYYRAYFEGRGWLCNVCGRIDEAMKHVPPYQGGK